jgi:hypothetical protein
VSHGVSLVSACVLILGVYVGGGGAGTNINDKLCGVAQPVVGLGDPSPVWMYPPKQVLAP